MQPILFVTPNPSIDKVVVVPGYRLGQIHRPQQVLSLPGGKGMNAARAARLLGANVHVCVLVAGYNGRWLVSQSEQEGVHVHAAWTDGETRACQIVVDPESRQMTEIYEYGEPIQPADWVRFEATFSEALSETSLAVFSGSLPPGAPPDGYARLIQVAQEQGIQSMIDARGESLKHALMANPLAVKINHLEAGDLLGEALESVDRVTMAAQQLVENGMSLAVITMGKKGAVAASKDGVWFATPPTVNAYLSVGSGDAMMGALALAHVRKQDLEQSLRAGVAAGLVNALMLGTGVVDADSVEKYVDQIQVVKLLVKK